MSFEWLSRILHVRETEVQEVFHIVRGTRILLRFVTVLAHDRSDSGLGNWELVDKKAVDPNPDIGYIPDLNRYVTVCNMKDQDGGPGNMKIFPNLGNENTRVNGWFIRAKRSENSRPGSSDKPTSIRPHPIVKM